MPEHTGGPYCEYEDTGGGYAEDVIPGAGNDYPKAESTLQGRAKGKSSGKIARRSELVEDGGREVRGNTEEEGKENGREIGA